jgi:hypothetical protein
MDFCLNLRDILINVNLFTILLVSGTDSLLWFLFIFWGGVSLCPLGIAATNWPIVPVPDDRR